MSTANGSAHQPNDYRQLSETLTFERADFSSSTVDGQQRYRAEKPVTLVIAYDGVVESNETFTITAAYSDPSQPYLQGGPARATITITDNLSSTADLYDLDATDVFAAAAEVFTRRPVDLRLHLAERWPSLVQGHRVDGHVGQDSEIRLSYSVGQMHSFPRFPGRRGHLCLRGT